MLVTADTEIKVPPAKKNPDLLKARSFKPGSGQNIIYLWFCFTLSICTFLTLALAVPSVPFFGPLQTQTDVYSEQWVGLYGWFDDVCHDMTFTVDSVLRTKSEPNERPFSDRERLSACTVRIDHWFIHCLTPIVPWVFQEVFRAAGIRAQRNIRFQSSCWWTYHLATAEIPSEEKTEAKQQSGKGSNFVMRK